ncbi:hypothetical protein H6G80_32410 [Nostoc sp. FACHB-87]|uniref:hypothetical protein n=1 Tax=Nostocales TaxID=1161 RepID=UPI0016894B7F|nr:MULTISPECIES: hypothetical protein [Nostocales]MBD2303499.1 hypothetical protein [Nostoc sp. FACHB-190]MBD2458752.1 hypothetical protein [Nostoc sp. FACHB-87]MBD2479791.1 hypothetical protein [Anabaena sp. FACHB-83]MBD2492160.1 hypothetical protein [Aulosira sp. FACHB-615]
MNPIIKKPEFRALKKSVAPQPATEKLSPVELVVEDPIVEQPAQEVTHTVAEELSIYAPLFQSVGNSGWQVSEIWRDLRVDGFCD